MIQTNNDGNTMLHFAAASDNVELVRDLLRGGADVNAQNNIGQTPLHIAFKHEKLEITLLLTQHGANPTIQDVNGNSPRDFDKSGIWA